jgi:threonine dehydratase
MERQKLVSEGAGAAPVAAAMFGKLPLQGKRTVCVISGGNIDVNILSRVINRGLAMSGRKATLAIKLTDKPGQLEQVSRIIASLGANVVSVDYDLSDPDLPISACTLRVGMETRDQAQIDAIKERLVDEGFQIVG